MHHTENQRRPRHTKPGSDTLLHLRDVELDMTLHLHVLFAGALDFVLDLLFEIDHLTGERVSMFSLQKKTK
jgi:hypothetical protein